jgi:CheY-like chemotaxis protein
MIDDRGKRILVVEDEEPLRACLRMLLEMEGHQVTEAGNGAEALDLFSMSHFDLVVTDFEMPVMRGNMLAVHLKQLAPSLPILMITASTMARRDAENPVDALLDKPFDVADLRGAVRTLLSARSQPAQPNVEIFTKCMRSESVIHACV